MAGCTKPEISLPADGLRYREKVTIVTGGTKGIGEGCVRVFVRNGAKVVFCGRDVESGKRVALEVNEAKTKENPGEATFFKCDVTKSDEIEALVAFTVDKYGRLDCVINNAGFHPKERPIDNFSAEDLKQLFEVNVVSYFLLAKHALPHLRMVAGNIINDSSLVAKIGQPGSVPYVMTKGAIDGLTKSLAIDEAAHDVRVNTVSPGNVWTPMWQWLADQEPTQEATERTIKAGDNAQLLGRMGTIEEAGQCFLWLAAEATFCTGIDIHLSGGAELSYGFKNRKL